MRPGILRAALLIAAGPLVLGATDLSANIDQRVLAAHNRERAALGVPPLRWNPALAASAQAWADHLGRTGRFEHAPEDAARPQGENLWAGTRGAYAAEAMVAAWVDEKRDYRPGIFPNNSRTGRYADVGHFTQLAWRRTDEVGCAWARGAEEDVLVCRYAQPGNMIGERPF